MTRNDPNAQNFDWVTARIECSLPNEFECIRQLVKTNCLTRRKSDSGIDLEFSGENGEDEFRVIRQPPPNTHGSSRGVRFRLCHDRIHVEDRWSNPVRTMKFTLTLNDDGECRFIIDGEGEHLRWQVARKALYGLFFENAGLENLIR